MSDMRHLDYLESVTAEDVRELRRKEATYQGSWKRRGGVGAFMMLARKWDRLEGIVSKLGKFGGDDKDAQPYDIFAWVDRETNREKLSGAYARIGGDGTALAEIRDLRRYCLLVEAEMMSRGVVPSPEVPSRLVPRRVSATEPDLSKAWINTVVKLAGFVETDQVSPSMVADALREQGRSPEYKSTLERGVEIERDFYRLKAQEWGVSPETAQSEIETALVHVREAREYVPESEEPQPAILSPWIERPEELERILDKRLRSIAYREWSKECSPLEPYLSEAEYYDLECAATGSVTVARVLCERILGCYEKIDRGYVLRVEKTPSGSRDLWPVLPAEMNAKEHASAEGWRRSLYEWSESETKFRMLERFRAWTERDR